MKSISITTVGAGAAVLMVACFVIGVAIMAAGGVEVLIPETGAGGLEWIADVDDAGAGFVAGAWLVVVGGLFGVVAFVGFYDALRSAGPVLVLAPILGAVGLTLVTVSHLIPLALAYELVPAYAEADAGTRASLEVGADTLASLAAVVNYAGNALIWAVAVPLYGLAVLRTSAVQRWIGWLGIAAGALGGWIGVLGPAWAVAEGISSLGFVAFFVFMASLGIALLRRGPEAGLEPATAA